MMKEFQDIQKINIRLAQKFEKMGFFKEADEIDNLNFMLSQRITIAGGPQNNFRTTKTGPTTPTTPATPNTPTTPNAPIKNFNIIQFLQGIQNAIKILTGKAYNLVKLIPEDKVIAFNNVFGKAAGSLTLLWEGYTFFTQYADDMSGNYGDSPREMTQIARSLAGVVGGLSMIGATVTGPLGGLSTVIAGIAIAINIALSFYLDIGNLEDEVDVDKKRYPANALVQDALNVAFPNFQKKPFAEIHEKLTLGNIVTLKQKIVDLAIKNNYSATSVQQAHQIIDGKTGAGTFSPRDIAKKYNIKPKIKPYKPSEKPLDKDMQRFDVPFTP